MKSHHILAWAILILFCCLPLSSAQKHIEILKLPFQESFQMSSADPRFYRLDLANALKGLDLIISVTPETDSYSPKLFVSNNKEFPQKMNDADYSSISTSRNVIFISSKDLQGNSNFLYIGLLCTSSKCNANIITEWTKEIQAIANGEKTIENSSSLNGARSVVVRLRIPKEDDLERIVINVDSVRASKNEIPALQVLINQGTSIPIAKNAENIKRRSSWFEGKTIIIEKDSTLFCNDCVFTLILRFKDSSSISVQAQSFQKNTPISGEARLDGVLKGKENSYRFTGRENYKEEDFILSVKIHSGKVKVYVNCDTQPQSSAKYYWNYDVEDSQDIILSHNVRSHCNSENYFILVQGEESSAYSLHASYTKSNQLFMGKASPVRDIISPQSKATYEILLPLFVAEEITLDLRYKQSLEINIINCRFSTDCPGIVPADRQHEITNYYGFDDHLPSEKVDYQSEEIASGGLLIKIDPHKSGCYPLLIHDQASSKEPIPVCAYLVTIENQQPSSVEFILTAEYEGPNWLTIIESKFDVVTKQNSLYYVISVPPQNYIESVQIQLTKFSGDLDIFVSKSNKYPNQQSDNSEITFSYEDLIIIKDHPDLSGVYYIGVHGLETSSFSLSATIQPKYFFTENSVFLLNPGKPQKGVLLPKHSSQAQYYKILVNQDKDWKGILRITVNSFIGHALIVVNNYGVLPTAEENMWEGNGHNLEIYSNDFDFKKQGLYYVGILIDNTAPEANLIADLAYFVTYSLVDKLPNPVHTFLSQNTPFFGALKQGESNYFEALVPADQFPLTIFKQSESKKLNLYISTDPQNKYPSRDSYTLTTTKDEITLEECETETGCLVYITAISTDKEEGTSSYSLSLSSQENSLIALESDRQIQFHIPAKNSPATFYYHAIPSTHSMVTVSCPGGEMTIYAKRIKIDVNSLEKPDIQTLNEKTAEFTSENQKGVNHISVPPLNDSEITIIAVSVYFKEISQDGPKTFTILARSQITQLSPGTPRTGFVERDHYMYFMVNVMRSDCTLLISLTNLDKDGDADLVIGHGENTIPTTSQNQFAYLSDKKTEVIEISNTDLPPSDSMSGNWIFGVYGGKASSFNITLVYEEQKMKTLQPQVPVEMSLGESSFVYFKFLHESPRNLQISFTKFSGKINLYMTSIDLNQDLVSNLPDQTHHKWQITRSNPQSSIIIPMQDYQACVSCLYLIDIEAISPGKFSLELNYLDKIVPVQDGVEYKGRFKPQESSIFMIKGSDNPEDEAQLSIEIGGNQLVILGSQNPSISLESFLWKEILTSKNYSQTISLKKPLKESLKKKKSDDNAKSQQNSFYILLTLFLRYFQKLKIFKISA